jgi:hypothetical protein
MFLRLSAVKYKWLRDLPLVLELPMLTTAVSLMVAGTHIAINSVNNRYTTISNFAF